MQNIIHYDSVDGWLELICDDISQHNIGLVVGLIGNGVFPALIVSNLIKKPLSFIKKEQYAYFPHYKEVENIFNLSKKGQKILLCFDVIDELSQKDILQLENFLSELGAQYLILAVNYDIKLKMSVKYFLPYEKQNVFMWNKNYVKTDDEIRDITKEDMESFDFLEINDLPVIKKGNALDSEL